MFYKTFFLFIKNTYFIRSQSFVNFNKLLTYDQFKYNYHGCNLNVLKQKKLEEVQAQKENIQKELDQLIAELDDL